MLLWAAPWNEGRRRWARQRTPRPWPGPRCWPTPGVWACLRSPKGLGGRGGWDPPYLSRILVGQRQGWDEGGAREAPRTQDAVGPSLPGACHAQTPVPALPRSSGSWAARTQPAHKPALFRALCIWLHTTQTELTKYIMLAIYLTHMCVLS